MIRRGHASLLHAVSLILFIATGAVCTASYFIAPGHITCDIYSDPARPNVVLGETDRISAVLRGVFYYDTESVGNGGSSDYGVPWENIVPQPTIRSYSNFRLHSRTQTFRDTTWGFSDYIHQWQQVNTIASSQRQWSFPLWLLLVVFSLPMLYSICRRIDWRRKPGVCRTCGYNLTANTSGVCPECGTAVQSDREVIT